MTLKEFCESKVAMSSHAFGLLVGDDRWRDNPPVEFLVYANSFYIEVLSGGSFALLLEREMYISGPGVELEDLEIKLYVWIADNLKPSAK